VNLREALNEKPWDGRSETVEQRKQLKTSLFTFQLLRFEETEERYFVSATGSRWNEEA